MTEHNYASFLRKGLKPASILILVFALLIAAGVFGLGKESLAERIYNDPSSEIQGVSETENNVASQWLAAAGEYSRWLTAWFTEGLQTVTEFFQDTYQRITSPEETPEIVPEEEFEEEFITEEVEEPKEVKEEVEKTKEEPTIIKEVIEVTEVRPVREVVKETVREVVKVDEESLKEIRVDIVDLQAAVAERLRAPGGVVSQTIYVKEPVSSPKLYQENGDIVLQTAGSGNVVISAATGLQLHGQQVIIESTNLNNPLISLNDQTRVAGSITVQNAIINAPANFTGNLLDAQLNGTSRFTINYLGATTLVGSFTLTGDMTQTGNYSLTGNLTMTGDFTMTGDQTINGRSTMTASNTDYILQLTQQGTGQIFNFGSTGGGVTTTLGTIEGTSTGTLLELTQRGTGIGLVVTSTATMASSTVEITNLGTGASFLIGDQDTDYSPFVITSSGRVGIGTTSPASMFELYKVNSAQSNNPTLTITNASTTANIDPTIAFRKQTTDEWTIYMDDSDEDKFKFATTADFLTLTQTGRAGLGTTTPQALMHLVQTYGIDSFRVDDATNERTRFVIDQSGNVGIATSTASYVLEVWGSFGLGTSTDEALLYGDSYNNLVGIATSSPTDTFSVQGNIIGSGNIILYGQTTSTIGWGLRPNADADAQYSLGAANYRWSNIYSATSTIGDTITIDTDDVRASGLLTVTAQAGILTASSSDDLILFSGDYLSATATDYISFATADSEKMRILSGGNVGIGTSTPSAQLHIIQVDAADAFRVDDATNETTPFVVDQSGNVGVGSSTPSDIFSVQGNIIGSGNIILFGSTTSTIANSLTVDTDVLFVDSYANQVGIGTVTPDFALEVVGTGFFSTSAGFGGTATTTGTALTFDGAGNITTGAASTWMTTAGDLTITSEAGDLYATATDVFVTATTGNLTASSADNLILFSGGYLTVTSTEYISFATADSEKMKILSGGNVGIGTTTPTDTLSVQGNIIGSGNIISYGTATSTFDGGVEMPEIKLTTGAVNRYVLMGDADGDASWQSTTTLGIVTSFWEAATANALRPIDLDGIIVTASSTIMGDLTVGRDALFVDESTGRVGIGTTTPVDMLHIYKVNTGGLAASSDVYLTLTQASTTGAADPYIALEIGTQGETVRWYMGIDDSDSDRFKIATSSLGSNDIFVIDKSGEGMVGIGSSTPSVAFSVQGNIISSGNIVSYSAATSTFDAGVEMPEIKLTTGAVNRYVLMGDADGDATWQSTTTLGMVTSFWEASGTNALAPIDLDGIVVTASSTIMGDLTVGRDALFVDESTGRVGIGTSTPSDLFSVQGNIIGSGNIISYGTATSTFDGGVEMPEIKLTTGAVNRYVLMGDADGDASWQSTTTLGIVTSFWEAATANGLRPIDLDGIIVTASSTIMEDLTVGRDALFVDESTGRVGVGTSTPGSLLAVGTTLGTQFLVGTAGAVTTTDISPAADATYYLGSADFRWSNIFAATTTIGGTVTIDTDDIRANGALTVTAQAGDLIASSSNHIYLVSDGILAVTSTEYISFATADSEKMRILSGGNVGIGSSTPSTVFSVQGDMIGSGNITLFGDTTSTIANSFTVDTNVLFVDSYGNQVGIGTVTPDFALEVVGTGFFSTSAGFGGTATTTGTSLTFDGVGNITAGAASTWMTTAGDLTITSEAGALIATGTDVNINAVAGNFSATSSMDIYFATAATERMRILSGGNIGIGTSSPTWKLEIFGGGICVDAAGGGTCPAEIAGAIAVDVGPGEGRDDSDATSTIGFDIAERYPSKEIMEPGDLVVVDEENAGYIKKSFGLYQSTILGIVSLKPAIGMQGSTLILAPKAEESSDNPYVVLAGRVPLKVSIENGPIAIGDTLTSASIPGVAMKATGAGKVVGMAMESHNSEEVGKIMVFVNIYSQGNDLAVIEAPNGEILNTEFQQGLASLGLIVNEYGVLEVGTVKAGKIIAEEFEMRDRATGEIYCTWIENGEWVKVQGECFSALQNSEEPVPVSAEASAGACENGINRPCGSSVGACQIGVQVCEQGVWGDCLGAVMPSEEIEDEVDNDCDGEIDEEVSAPESEPAPDVIEPVSAEASAGEEPVVEEPVVEEPAVEEPILEEPAEEEPVAEEPVVEEPSAEEPAEPVVEEPVVEEPTAEAAEEPITEESAASESEDQANEGLPVEG